MMSARVSYRFLGRSGLKVSNICLGTMTFGERKGSEDLVQCTEPEAHALLDRFVELGGNFIDTADIYQHGTSEEIIGNWLVKQKREKIVLASKVRGSMDPGNPNAIGLSRVHIMKSIDDSLRRLQTDYIDLYQMHCWDYATPIEETLSTLNDLVRMGKIRYIGTSNVTGWQLQKMVDLTKQHGWAPIVTLQQQWSLLSRGTEWELVEVCRNEGIGFLPWSPLKGGWLTGKFRKGQDLPSDSRVSWATSAKAPNQSHPNYEQFANDKTWNLIDLMDATAKKHGKSVAQVALRWLLEKDVVCSVIIGAKKLSQLDDNLGASGDWSLSSDEMHWWDYSTPIEETLSTLNDLVRMGKIRYIGTSNVTGWQLQKMVDLTKQHGWAPIVTLQQQWSLLSRGTEWELVEVCRNEGIGFLPWSPLKGGWLSGKFCKGQAMPLDSRVAWASAEEGRANQCHPHYEPLANDKTWAVLELLEATGLKHGEPIKPSDKVLKEYHRVFYNMLGRSKSVAQVALRWLLEKDVVCSVIIGAKKLSQLDDNLGASGDWSLSSDEVGALDEASATDVPYPYEAIFRLNKDRRRVAWMQ